MAAPSVAKGSMNGDDPPSTSSSSVAAPPMSPVRKQLPALPDSETQLALSQRASVEKKLSSPRGNNTYGPFFLEYSLLAEYTQLQNQKLPGVYVIPSAKSALLWNGVLFIRQGLYQEGVFRFSLFIPDNYPDGDCPRLVFDPPIFHPVVDPVSGELDVKRAFQRWRRNVNRIAHILLYARRVFYKIDTKSPLNPQAAVLYEQDLELFKDRVSRSIRLCKEKMYEAPSTDDPYAFRFSKWDPEVHEEARKQMLQQPKVNKEEADK